MKYLHFLSLSFLLILSGSLFAAPSVSVTFVMDESGSVSSSNFQLENQGFINALNGLPTDGSVEISIVGFASSSQTIQSPTVLTSANFNTVKAALEANVQNSGGTNMSGAINHAAGLLNPSYAATKIICLSTDGAPNSSSATTTAATNAKNSGITLSPVGIGLNSSGKTFLDSIASNPPIPNPTDFNEFATVVRNNCVGIVNSALNIQLTPDPVDFGSFNSQTISEDLSICAKDPQTVGVLNKSNQSAKITKIEIVGDDADDFELVSFMGEDVANLTYPISIPPSFSTQMKVKLNPNSTPEDKTYDASVKLTAEDSSQVSGAFSTTLIAKVDPDIPSCLGMSMIDASPLIYSISDIGKPLKKDNSEVSEIDVALALQNDKTQELNRKGLVADGNARLLLVSRTRQNTGKIRMEIINPTNVTETKLYSLENNPTYRSQTDSQRIYDTNGQTTIDLDIATDPDGFGQITAVLRAGERFFGGNSESVKYKIKACILENGSCGEALKEIEIFEQKAPVILIHGLWANGTSWEGSSWGKATGVRPKLLSANYKVGLFNYDDQTLGFGNSQYANRGPSLVMPEDEDRLANMIKDEKTGLCDEYIKDDIACTRSDIVSHSMGGLVARKFIFDNKNYRSSLNYNQGSVRRLITLGTPHNGSALANTLLYDNTVLNNCIRDDDPDQDGIQNTDVQEAINALDSNDDAEDRLVDQGAIEDLTITGGSFGEFIESLSELNQVVPTFAIRGNIGQEFDLGPYKAKFVTHQIGDAGCTYNDVFGNDDSDGVVPVTSAWGRVTENQEFQGVEHVGMGSRNDIGDRVVELLDTTLNIFATFARFTEKKSKALESASTMKKDTFSKTKKTITALFFTIFGINTANAQEASPSISLSTNKTTIAPGETVNLTADTTGKISNVYLTDKQFYDEEDSNAPFEWNIDIPQEGSGSLKLIAYTIEEGSFIESNEIEIKILPDITNLKSLAFEVGSPVLLKPGKTKQTTVVGLFNDGHTRKVTEASMGTSYSENIVNGVTITSGDSPIISVSADGMITALKPGEAEIVATNNGKIAIRRVEVIAAKVDDADGDNLTDSYEDSINTNKYHPDSDGDGSPDNIEVGADPTNPLDSNEDGIIDALDNTAMAIKDVSDNYVSIKTSAGKLSTPFGKKLSNYPERQGNLAQMDMKRGLLAFRIEGLTAGQSIDVTLDFDSLPTGTNKYLKYGSKLPSGGANEWYEFTDFNINGNRITLHLTDNQLGDSNPVPGVISDPGGPASDSSSTGNDGANGNSSGGGSFDPIFILLSLLAFFHLLRRRKS